MRVAKLHAVPLGTKLVTNPIALATMLLVGAGVDASAVACGLRRFAQETADTLHAAAIFGASVVARSAVFRRALRIDADIVTDHIGIGAMFFAYSVDAKLVV
jgi:hypothetical protein